MHEVIITEANKYLHFKFFVHGGIVRKGVCATVDTWRSKNDSQELFLSFNKVDFKNITQVINLGSKHLSIEPLALAKWLCLSF